MGIPLYFDFFLLHLWSVGGSPDRAQFSTNLWNRKLEAPVSGVTPTRTSGVKLEP